MTLESALSHSVPASFRKSALFSRFTSPLASRNRHVTDFHVEPDDPWKSCGPGEVVKGCVVLTVIKPLPITHLVVCLHGSARVHKNQVVPSEDSTSGFLGPGRGRRGLEYLGNGFASLFEDETVLCGEGLLRKGIYKFQFELRFPSHRLPSSIDFERGKVAYYITATATRPTTIAPTFSCDRPILFQDAIELNDIPLPKPRVISLEPMSSRSMKAKAKQTSLDTVQRSSVLGVARNGDSSDAAVSLSDIPPLSPAPSERSYTSAATTSSQSFQIVNHPSPASSASIRNDSRSSRTSTPPNAITASTELLKSGALPGESVPLRILIQHSKASARGLIVVTLYRQGRIDMHPQLPVTSARKGKKPEYEDVYPRSKSGLRGLQFSNSSPSSLFRKDLCQTSAIMVVNPATLTSEVRTSIKIPEDAFPTMTNVPGSMIEFKYFVEVVMDLTGKLGESRLLPRISLTSPPRTFTNNTTPDVRMPVTSNWADNILDTAQLRRVKGIVSCLFDVVVGSKISTRMAKRAETSLPSSQPDSPADDWGDQNDSGQWAGNGYYRAHHDPNGWADDHRDWAAEPPVPRFVPPPEPEEDVDEKTRLKREAAFLLPSQPPGDTPAGPSTEASSSAPVPSAPFIQEEAGQSHAFVPETSGVTYGEQVQHSATSARSVETVVPSYSDAGQGPSNRDSPARVDDKQELERQRLLNQASAPAAEDAEDVEDAPGPSSAAEAPSAPSLSAEDEYNAHTLNAVQGAAGAAADTLPQYRR